MVDRVATGLVALCVWIAVGALSLYVLREVWLGWRARRLAARVDLLRDLLAGTEVDARAFGALRRKGAVWRDLQALEHLLEERRAALPADATPEAVQALFASYDALGIVDRYIHKLQHARSWAERAFAARFLGEIGSARAVAPLIEVMRDTREEDRDVRMAAGRALGRIRDPRAIEPLLAALAAPESWLPARVAEVILQFGGTAVEPLLALLQSAEDSNARAWAAQILGDLRDPRAVPPLTHCLTDLNDQVRARAANSLGKLGDRRAVPELIRIMLGDPVPYVRIQVVRALGALGDARALHHLIDALKDGEWWVRIRVVEALEQLGEQAVEPLFLALEDRDTEVRSRAAMTLERLGVLDHLVEKLAEVDAGAREKLLAAGQAGVVEILIEALDHADPRVRFVVTEILGEVRNPGVSVGLISRLEKETDGRIRAAAVRALAQLEEPSAAVPISRLLGDADERIRVEAVRALERLPVTEPHLLLGSAVRDPEPRVRAGAAVVLGKVGDAHAVPLLLELLSDADATVRTEGARALGLLRAEDAVRRLMEAFHDYDAQVQVAAARALGQIGSSACLETLVRGLENASPELGSAIAWSLGRIAWDDPERLIDVLFQGNDRSSRLGAVAAMAQMGHATGRELIRSMLHDTDEEVVREAIMRLGELQDRESLQELHALLESPVETTRLAAIEALCRIGDRASLEALRQAVADPATRVRAQAVLALAYLGDLQSADLLRDIVAAERSTPAMRAHALLGLMAFGREADLPLVLEGLRAVPLYDFLHERARLEDPILRATVERVRGSDCVEYMVASIQSRAELEAALVQELASAQAPERRVRIVRTLAYLESKNAYPAVWRAFYKDPSEDVRVAALQFLGHMAPAEDFFRLLMDGLNDLQPRVRAESLRRLEEVPVERALPLVMAHLASPDDELQEVLLEYLAGLPEVTLERFLDGVLGTPLEMAARQLLVRVLGRSRHPEAAQLLEAFLAEAEPQVRRAAVQSLGQLSSPQTVELVRGCLQDPDVKVRVGALDAAAGFGSTVGVPLLREALQDPVAEVRRRTLLLLSHLAPHESLDELRNASRDPDPQVRAAALAALLLEGSQPVEDWLGAHDVPSVAAALAEIGGAAELERRLVTVRSELERIGALKALFFRDSTLRTRALAAARVDPAPRVQAVGRRLEEILAGWLADPDSAATLQAAAVAPPAPVAPEEPAAHATPADEAPVRTVRARAAVARAAGER